MKKDIIVTLIAGTFFAASVVGPAFASDTTTASVASQPPVFVPTEGLPDIDISDRLPSLETLGERLRKLDIGEILDREVPQDLPIPVNLPDVVELPELGQPEVEPPAPTTSEPVVSAPTGDAEEEEAEVEVDVDDAEAKDVGGRSGVPAIVAGAKAEKAAILAAHGGDRRAAKAEMKAAQKRMVARIKASKRAEKRGKGKPF